MNILFITDILERGGRERYLVEILRGCKEQGINTVTASFYAGKYESEYRKHTTLELLNRRNRYTLKHFAQYYNLIRKYNIDIVHSLSLLGTCYIWGIARITGCRFIEGSIQNTGGETGIMSHLLTWFTNHSDLAIGNSMAGLKHYQVRDGFVIDNFIDLDRFTKQSSGDTGNIVMTANFTDKKDHETFFTAVIPLLEEGLLNGIYLLGKGPLLEKYQTRYAASPLAGQIHFMGSLPNVEEVIANCDIGVLCSTRRYKEGISNSVLEYMAAGLIPVASDIGGTSEIIDHEVNGLLFECENPDDLQKKLRKLLNHQYDTTKLHENARKKMADKFDYSKNIQKLFDFYKQLLD
ncbi:MAG: glycosyltransferase family 4 protein [Candidatus Cloacimonetes bacterium]|nr:glycosyltransferase family 4 protein [Candidatus Cloacimonadota bacterium]